MFPGIAIIPESLVAVLTITMAIGMRTMAKRKVIVRKLDALEALGGVDSICSDKTGTLTQGKMITRAVWIPTLGHMSVEGYGDAADPTVGRLAWTGDAPAGALDSGLVLPDGEKSDSFDPDKIPGDLLTFLQSAAMCNIANVRYNDTEQRWQATGEPTEIALQVLAHRFRSDRPHWVQKGMYVPSMHSVTGLNLYPSGWKQLLEYPFDSECKRMSVVYLEPNGSNLHLFAKGAVERIIDQCSYFGYGDKTREITVQDKQTIVDEMERLAKQGLVRCTLARAPRGRWTHVISLHSVSSLSPIARSQARSRSGRQRSALTLSRV